MKRTKHRILTTLMICLLAAACQPKQGGRAGKEEAPPPAEKPQEIATPPREAPKPDPGQKCGGFQEKQEAKRRAAQAMLMEPLRAAGQHGTLMDFITAVADLADRKAFGELEALGETTGGEVKIYKPDWSESHAMYMMFMAREGLSSFAACRALNDDDTTWCEALEGTSDEGVKTCSRLHFYYRTLATRVILEQTDCQEAMSEASLPGGMSAEEAIKGCQAVVDQRPDDCPFEKGTRRSALCRALAARDGRGPCEEFKSEHQDRWVPCCQSFAWRFANVAGGMEDPRLVPELGALTGEPSGCERALVWDLFARLAPLFGVVGVEGKSTPPIAGEPRPEPCPYQVQWSPTKVPGR